MSCICCGGKNVHIGSCMLFFPGDPIKSGKTMTTPLPFNYPWDDFVREVDELKQELREKPMTRVKFVYREQLIQVIEGENSRKGELSVITRDKDVPAHEVEHTVRRIANAQ